MNQKKYVDIARLKASYSEAFEIGEEITLSEKVDGANASFSYEMIPEFGKICASLTMEHVRHILAEKERID